MAGQLEQGNEPRWIFNMRGSLTKVNRRNASGDSPVRLPGRRGDDSIARYVLNSTVQLPIDS